MHGRAGKITNIRDHQDGKHAEITITHGKRKRSKGMGAAPGELMSYHQHTSNVVMPKAHAKNYALGQSVNAGIEPYDGNTEGDGDSDDAAEIGQNGAVSESRAMPGKQSGATSVKPAKSTKTKQRILTALKGKKK